ncbi:MAG TPA: 2-amino-4-ketopentanoate thiolase [Thermoanaerobacter sp.]|nr:2-amino-4-ketopentanoate thiolase [Thermoanaerobacter sp.]
MAQKGDWVKIKQVILEPEERAENIPQDTKETPLTMWVKGLLLQDGEIGDTVKIKTFTGRIVEGVLVEVNPRYIHDFGNPIPELIKAGIKAREILYGGEENE